MKYFGTDGIRDKWQVVKGYAFSLGVVLGKDNGSVVVGRDTRPSSFDIEKELVKGLLSSGAKVYLAGVIPTPALSYIAFSKGYDKGVMITASHNPPEFNGLKVLCCGEKMGEEDESALDKALDDELRNPSKPKKQGEVVVLSGGVREYKRHVIDLFRHLNFGDTHKKIYLDTAHGCFSYLAKDVVETLGGDVVALNNDLDGEKVNVGCGALHVDEFCQKIPKDSIGFAFDGDGDRVLAVVDGKIFDGDQMLYNLAVHYKNTGKTLDGVVGTVMTGTGIERALLKNKIKLHRTDVGDKHVFDCMKKENLILGGEKSGHLIIGDKTKTGDGLVTLLAFLEVFLGGKVKKVKEYKTENFGLEVENPKKVYMSEEFQKNLAKTTLNMGEKGRLIVRPSGTENLIRITVEEYFSNLDYSKIVENLLTTKPCKN